MKDYYDNSWMESNRWGEWGEEDEVGVMNDLTPELVPVSYTHLTPGIKNPSGSRTGPWYSKILQVIKSTNA